jgi:hypothetical protein
METAATSKDLVVAADLEVAVVVLRIVGTMQPVPTMEIATM